MEKKEIINQVMWNLSKKRPIFHSELDFQFDLAREIDKTPDFQGYKIRLERPVPIIEDSIEKRYWQYPDISVFRSRERLYLFELKYKKQLTKTTNLKDHEQFNLRNDSAPDFGRYDFINDIVRLESFTEIYKEEFKEVRGYAIFLTNDDQYWTKYPVRKVKQIDWDFRIHEGQVLKGTLKWNPNKEGKITATKERQQKLNLNNQYEIKWKDYSNLNENVEFKPSVDYPIFKYLIVEV